MRKYIGINYAIITLLCPGIFYQLTDKNILVIEIIGSWNWRIGWKNWMHRKSIYLSNWIILDVMFELAIIDTKKTENKPLLHNFACHSRMYMYSFFWMSLLCVEEIHLRHWERILLLIISSSYFLIKCFSLWYHFLINSCSQFKVLINA